MSTMMMLAGTFLLLALSSSRIHAGSTAEDIVTGLLENNPPEQEEPKEMRFGTFAEYTSLKTGWATCELRPIMIKWYKWFGRSTGPEAERCRYKVSSVNPVTAEKFRARWFKARLVDNKVRQGFNRTVIYVETPEGKHRIRLCLEPPPNTATCQQAIATSKCTAFDVSQWQDTSNVQNNGVFDATVHARVTCYGRECPNNNVASKVTVAAVFLAKNSDCSSDLPALVNKNAGTGGR